MRTKSSIINSIIGMITFILSFLPMFIVRKVFLDTLGSDLLGLNSLYSNIIGYLSIVEMGIGTAIIFSLYKPYYEKRYEKINAYIKYYKKIYFNVGITILILGIFLIPFINYFVIGDIPINEVKLGFFLFLLNSFLGYLFTYKHCILNVIQEGYKISIVITSAKILIAILQVIILNYGGNFYSYLLVQIFVNLSSYILLNLYINKRFSSIFSLNGKLEEDENKELRKNIKGLFFHKIGYILVCGTDNLVLSKFVNLGAVTLYNNYYMVIYAFNGIITKGMGAITPSIGNFIAEKNKNDIYEIHKKIFFVNFWLVSFIIISLYNTITQFISIWLGENQIIDNVTLNILLISVFIQMMRGTVDQFKEGAGEYYRDRYAPIVEGGINLISSLILVEFMGLRGVLLGTLISNIFVVFWIKPLIVYKYIFNKNLIYYFRMYFKYLVISIIPFLITRFLTHDIKSNIEIGSFMLNCIINIIIINGSYFIIFRNTNEYLYIKKSIFKILKNKKDKSNNLNN